MGSESLPRGTSGWLTVIIYYFSGTINVQSTLEWAQDSVPVSMRLQHPCPHSSQTCGMLQMNNWRVGKEEGAASVPTGMKHQELTQMQTGNCQGDTTKRINLHLHIISQDQKTWKEGMVHVPLSSSRGAQHCTPRG